jgi:pimeloyl-ACP methyl ester carboxylesterase
MTLGFHLVIRGSKSSGQRVVLLHGWLQSSDVWLLTARHLADRFGHEGALSRGEAHEFFLGLT